MTEFKVLWKGNILSLMKGFGTDRCKLFMKERTEIIRRMYFKQGELINSNFKIYGASRHKTSFHRYQQKGIT